MNIKLHKTLLCILVLLVVAPAAYAQGILTQYRTQIAEVAAEDSIASITTGVIVGGELVQADSFGCADCETNTLATPKHIYRVGSISKTMTSTLLAQLIHEGTINLDDKLSQYIPEVSGLIDDRGWAGEITLRHLANHTSGLDREPSLEGAARGPIAGWKDKIIASIPTTSINTKPGTKYAYSNIGYGILGLAIERAVEEPFMDLMQRKLFDPLGMENTTFILSDEQMTMMSTGYQGNPNDDTFDRERPYLDHAGRGYKVPNGGIYTTVADLAKYVIALTDEGSALSAHVKTLIHEFPEGISTSPDNPKNVYGLGVTMTLSDDGEILRSGHGGSVAGYTAWMGYSPKHANGIILLRNYNKGGGYKDITIAQEILAKLDSM